MVVGIIQGMFDVSCIQWQSVETQQGYKIFRKERIDDSLVPVKTAVFKENIGGRFSSIFKKVHLYKIENGYYVDDLKKI